MTRESSRYKITVMAPTRSELMSHLDRAVQDGITEALKCGSGGIVVTRHDYARFTVELTDEVLFGITLEVDQLHRPGK